jgi:hypothetical protein
MPAVTGKGGREIPSALDLPVVPPRGRGERKPSFRGPLSAGAAATLAG